MSKNITFNLIVSTLPLEALSTIKACLDETGVEYDVEMNKDEPKFTTKRTRTVLSHAEIADMENYLLRAGFKDTRPGQTEMEEVAKKFGVSYHVVRNVWLGTHPRTTKNFKAIVKKRSSAA